MYGIRVITHYRIRSSAGTVKPKFPNKVYVVEPIGGKILLPGFTLVHGSYLTLSYHQTSLQKNSQV